MPSLSPMKSITLFWKALSLHRDGIYIKESVVSNGGCILRTRYYVSRFLKASVVKASVDTVGVDTVPCRVDTVRCNESNT